jgi:hypothetical protein
MPDHVTWEYPIKPATRKLCLAAAVFLGDVTTIGAGLAGVVWRRGDEHPATPACIRAACETRSNLDR